MSTGHSDDDAYRECIAHTHTVATRYDDGQTFDTSAWATVAVDPRAEHYTND